MSFSEQNGPGMEDSATADPLGRDRLGFDDLMDFDLDRGETAAGVAGDTVGGAETPPRDDGTMGAEASGEGR